MIAYFPDLYEDELLYSLFARFFAHSGYIVYKDVADELFVSNKIRPSREFVSQLKPETEAFLTRNTSMEKLIEKHTMFPYYGRFIGSEKRNTAFKALISLNGDYSKLLGVPQLRKGEQRYLRYCPLCAVNDRERHGETYWHRVHQMRGAKVCPLHNCYLADSGVSLDSRISVKLIPAEQCMPSETDVLKKSAVICKNPLELKLAQYMAEVFLMPLDRDMDISVGRFLHSKMRGTPYLSSRGEHNYVDKLNKDLQTYYYGIPCRNDLSKGHIQRLLSGQRVVFHEICMTAVFLNISAETLAGMKMPLKPPEKQFDEEVKELLGRGMGIRETARRMGVGASVVRMSVQLSGKEPELRKKPANHGGRVKDWSKTDRETLPLVRQEINRLKHNGMDRPCRITMYAVSKRLNIPNHALNRMEMCRDEIYKNYETDEQFRARKIKWAVDTLLREGKPLVYWRISALTKLDGNSMKSCLPYMDGIIEPDIIEMLKKELTNRSKAPTVIEEV